MNRKSFIQKAGTLSLITISGSTLLTSCGGGTQESGTELENTGTPTEEPPVEEAAPAQADVDCSEYNQDLTQADMNTRQALNYVEQTEIPEQNCKNCRFWQEEKFDGPCGGCQLISNGAVNPQGWCQSWVAQQA